MDWIKKHPSVLTAAALVLLVAVLLIDSLVIRLSVTILGISVIIALVLVVVSFIMIRRGFHAELKKSMPDSPVFQARDNGRKK